MPPEESISIKELLEYPDKIYKRLGKIDIEGILKRTNAPKVQRKEKTEKERGYHFTAQFLVVDDSTGSIGVNVTYPGDGPALSKEAQGKRVKIENAEAGSYQGQKGTQRVLNRGRVSLLEKVEPAKESSSEKTEPKSRYGDIPPEVWDKKQLIITKSAIVKALFESGRKWDKETEKQATDSLNWIYNNIDKDEKDDKQDEQIEQEVTNRIKEMYKLQEKFEKNEWREILAGFDMKDSVDIENTDINGKNVIKQIKDMVKAKEMEEE